MVEVISHKDRGHSPLGASGAERWMKCPGSVTLLKALTLPETDDPSYRREGTAMHEAAAHCLDNAMDTWEIEGQTFNDTVLDRPMAQAVQVYLDVVRGLDDAATRTYVEYPISSPVHPSFFGTLDFGAVSPNRIRIVDFKGGEGIIVDPDDNPQLKYYAFGLIDGLERQEGMVFADDTPVDLGIVQPRGFSLLGPVRFWATTVGEIKEWVRDTLVPAMCATEYDNTLDPGPWCRFCSAKLVCPMLTSLFGAATIANPKHVANLNNQSLGRSYQYVQAVKFYLKAMEEETFRRLNIGDTVPGTKLVKKKANRVYKDGAGELAKKRFGPEAFTKPELKSPAELEKVGPEAKAWVQQFAYLPETGLTVALLDDPRPAQKVDKASAVFASVMGLTAPSKAD